MNTERDIQETKEPKKLLSPKGAIVFSEHKSPATLNSQEPNIKNHGFHRNI
jgi:hypothetical protein